MKPRGDALGWKLQAVVLILAFAALVSRRPDALLLPQLYGEDGSIWYPEAYMFGWFTSLFHSQNGYYQTVPRLGASIALLVPLAEAPLVMNLLGYAIQVLPVTLLLSSRCREWGPLWVRGALGAVYLALPNSHEVHVAMEEAQWHLGLVSAIVVLSAAPSNPGWRLFDAAVLIVGGLSGPFGMLLLPVAAVMWWRRREGWRLATMAIIAATSAVQVSALLETAAGTRPQVGLGASLPLFVRLVGARVVGATLFGRGGESAANSPELMALLAAGGGVLAAYCLWKARPEVRLAVAFSFLVFAASLRNPMVSHDTPQWQVLWQAPGIRYWFFPTVAFAWAVVWCATSAPHLAARVVGIGVLAAMSIGIQRDWRYPAWPDLGWAAAAQRFDAAPPGSFHELPIFPPGWKMRITKASASCRTLPFGWLDGPPGPADAPGAVRVSGWVIAYQPIRHVAVHVDGREAAVVPLNVPRPDVDAFYPGTPVPVKGFAGDVDLSGAAAGPHLMEFRAVQADGCDAAFATAPVRKE